MALSATDLATLDTAIASGALTVEIEGRRVTYRSIAELKEARKHVAEQIEQQKNQASAAAASDPAAFQRYRELNERWQQLKHSIS